MFEIIVFCIILLAAGYWATLFVMGRRDDVIHGKFVHSEDEPDTAVPAMTASAMPISPPFPKRPMKVSPLKALQPANDAMRPVDSAALQSLLAAIQQDLKGAA
jgi:hypothetical protein